jgi:predicted hydrocarbon binding protein
MASIMAETPKQFFVMPGDALIDLREELEITEGDEKTKEILKRYGARCGESLVDSLGIKCTLGDIRDTFSILWAETGLARAHLREVDPEKIVVELEDSIEAGKKEKCHFTRGYLEGVLFSLLSKNYSCEELSCRSEGNPICTFKLIPKLEQPMPVTEKATTTEKKEFDLETGYAYLIEEEEPSYAYKIFVDYVKHGHSGLCITRDFPKKVKGKWGLENTPFMWLTMDESTDVGVTPTNLPLIYNNMKKFLSQTEKGVIMLAGMEYLITQTTYDSVLKLLLLLNDKIAVHDALLIIPLSPFTLEEKQLKMIERECKVIKPKG